MIDKKKIGYKAIAYSTVGLALVGSSLLISLTANNRMTNTRSTVQVDNVTTNQKVANAGSVNPNDFGFTIRSNPTNGFNGLTTPDGKFTYVLITKNGATADAIGGSNSGVACIDNTTGNAVGSPWYLPDGNDFKNNYTTNIVFGQKEVNGKTVFDQSKIFVLCGISNLAAAINSAYTSYTSKIEPVGSAGMMDKQIVTFDTKVAESPTIKIFPLNLGSDGSINGSQTQFYNFAYPSDGTNGFAGFNASGVPYASQTFYALTYPRLRPGQMADVLSHSLIVAKNVQFTGISRTSAAWENGKGFQPIEVSPNAIYTEHFVGAFGSYLTYLTYGQNFAYHLNNTYKNPGDTTIHQDEFLMSTSFVNVDQNLGGLYSALVNHVSDIDDTTASGMISKAKEQNNWPIPFGYQWLLADIAHDNAQAAKDEAATPGSQKGKPQYSYVDASGKKVQVNWGDALALSAPIMNFLNDNIFPLIPEKEGNSAFIYQKNELGSLYSALQAGGCFGSSWGLSTGYIIFTPAALGETNFDASKNEYRYYYVSETAVRSFDDASSSIAGYSTPNSSYVFTNLLTTDQLSNDGSLSYLIGVAYIPSNSSMRVGQFWTLSTFTYNSMFCYDWNSISNDDGEKALVASLADNHSARDDQPTAFFYANEYHQHAFSSIRALARSFDNWNLVFLGGPTAGTIKDGKDTGDGIKKMDSSFTIDPTWGGNANSIVYQLANNASEQNPVNLGRRLTYLRRKISFVVHPQSGFVYFTSGTGLEWQNGLSLWDVRALGTNKSLFHKYGDGQKFVGNVYLSNQSSSTPMWSDSDEAVWDIKVLQQTTGNPGPTLAFITSKGIYTVGGGANVNDYVGSVNNVLGAGGTSSAQNYKSGNEVVLNAILNSSFTNLEPAADFTPVLPNTLVLNSNILQVLTKTPTKYSVQLSANYLLSDLIKQNLPTTLMQTPAAKPLLVLDDTTTIDAAAVIKPIAHSDKTIRDLMSMNTNALFTNFLQIPIGLQASWAINFDYSSNLIESASEDNTTVKISFPVTYNNLGNVTYLAPIKNKNGNVLPYYLLDGLRSSNYARPLVVLKKMYDISQTLNKDEWTAEKLVNAYGGNTFDQTKADAMKNIFVDVTLTKEYLDKHPQYFTSSFEYWLKPTLAPNGGIALTLYYRGVEGQPDWSSTNSGIVMHDYYNGGSPSQINDGGNGTFSVSAYTPAIDLSGGTNVALVAGICVAVIVAVTVALGLGIGLPMRKQHKINVLNSKITNKRIDKLSTAVSASFKKVIETTATINSKVEQLSSTVNRSLTAGKTPPPGAPRPPLTPTRPTVAPSAPSAPRPPVPPRPPVGK